MYNRLDRKKNPPDIKMKNKGGLPDLFDNALKETYIITDGEYDTLLEGFEDDDSYLDLLLSNALTFKESKKLLLAIKSLL